MIRSILFAVTLFLVPSVAQGQTPFDYSRSRQNTNSTVYYGRYGQIVGRSFSTPNRTYFSSRNGSMIGSSFTTRSGNTYFNRYRNTYSNRSRYNPYSYRRNKR